TNDYARWFRHSFLALIVLPHNRRTIESQHGSLSPNAELAPSRCKVLVNFGSCSNSSVLSLIEPILYRCPDQRAIASRRAPSGCRGGVGSSGAIPAKWSTAASRPAARPRRTAEISPRPLRWPPSPPARGGVPPQPPPPHRPSSGNQR